MSTSGNTIRAKLILTNNTIASAIKFTNTNFPNWLDVFSPVSKNTNTLIRTYPVNIPSKYANSIATLYIQKISNRYREIIFTDAATPPAQRNRKNCMG